MPVMAEAQHDQAQVCAEDSRAYKQRHGSLTLLSPELGMRSSRWALLVSGCAGWPATSVIVPATEPGPGSGLYGRSGQDAMRSRASPVRVERSRWDLTCDREGGT